MDFFELSRPGVFCIKNYSTKEVYISCSNFSLQGICTIISKMKNNDHVCSKMTNPVIEILEFCDVKDYRFLASKYIQKLNEEGWKVLNTRSPIILALRVRTIKIWKELLIVVTIRQARGEEFVVAVFEHMDKANRWLDKNYPNKEIREVVYLENALTKSVIDYFENGAKEG